MSQYPDPGEGGQVSAGAVAASGGSHATAHVASLAPTARASVVASLDRAAILATGNEHADGVAFPWHRRPPATLTVHGKGRRERLVYLEANECSAAVSAWLRIRGSEDGPLFLAVNKGGKVLPGGMSLRAIGKRVQVLGERAGRGKVSPYLLRRSLATALLSAGNDLSVTAAAHAVRYPGRCSPLV